MVQRLDSIMFARIGIRRNKITQHESQLKGRDICSAVKENYIKCETNLNDLSLHDKQNKKVNNSDVGWVNLEYNAIIHIKGKWESKTQIGLQVDCTDSQIFEKNEK